ncbi:MAG: 30S ribosome-binding factor RbfA [Treponema sp.]|jgi:ribosome-binding factor A|nr:30S ribosome-binding factor RbfA [Treponema sp.]
MGTYRTERIGRLVQEKIGALILEARIKDPRVHPLLSVTRVRVSRDLAFADVYVSAIQNSGGVARAVEGLQSAAGFIQTELASVMRIRKIPRLRFHADTGIQEAFDLVKKIERIAGGRDSGDPAGDPSGNSAGDSAGDDERQ